MFFLNQGWEWNMFPGADGHDVSGKPRQEHPAVQPEPDSSQGFQLQPGPAGHRPAAGAPAALPGSCAGVK